MEQEKIDKFFKELDAWLKTEEHLFDCIGYNEGQFCCLDDTHGHWQGPKAAREKIKKILKNL